VAQSSRSGPESPLVEIVARIVDLRRDQGRISPSWVATEAMLQIDPEKVIQQRFPLAYLASHLELRQIARSVCRGLFEDDDDKSGDSRQHELFPDLQWRYPAAKSKDQEEPEYVLRELMEPEDVYYNVSRLRAEAETKLRHADALEAWAKKKFGRRFRPPKRQRRR
jgi:hypothetical protein